LSVEPLPWKKQEQRIDFITLRGDPLASESRGIYDRIMLWVLDLIPPRKLLARLHSCSLVVANKYEADFLLPNPPSAP
jgi:hypothetical protein